MEPGGGDDGDAHGGAHEAPRVAGGPEQHRRLPHRQVQARRSLLPRPYDTDLRDLRGT